MSLLKSILFGSAGSYNILGFDIEFKKTDEAAYEFDEQNEGNLLKKSICHLAGKCLNSKTFHILTQGHSHAFVHEMGHALSHRFLVNHPDRSNIEIYVNSCTGTTYLTGLKTVSPKVKSLVLTAGPMADIAFSSCKLVAAVALRNYISKPVAFTLGVGAVTWMSGELLYACVSASNKDSGDFGRIAKTNKKHLVAAMSTLIGLSALGIFSAAKFLG